MGLLGNKEAERSWETATRERVSDDRATAEGYRQTAKRFVILVALFLVAAVVLFAVGRIAYGVVACWSSILNAALVVYLTREAGGD